MAKNPKMNWDNIFIHSKQGGTGTQIGNFKESTGGGTPMEKGQKSITWRTHRKKRANIEGTTLARW